MEYITLKNSDLKVSRLCMGGCQLGGYGWGEISEDNLKGAVYAALENGINFFDTADTYGLGQSEILLASALGNHRRDVIIQSKFGVRVLGGKTIYDNSPDYIQEALEKSLTRLGTDYIDVYTVHYRDGKTPIEEVIGKLEQLKEQGKILYFGLSNVHDSDFDELIPYKGKFVCCQNEYSLACRKNENDLYYSYQQLEANPLTWGSLGQGILTGKYDKENIHFGKDDRRSREVYVNFHGDKLNKNFEIIEIMKKIAEAHNKSLSSVAIRFILDYMPEAVVLCGVKDDKQILENIEAFDWKLSMEELNMLDKVSR